MKRILTKKSLFATLFLSLLLLEVGCGKGKDESNPTPAPAPAAPAPAPAPAAPPPPPAAPGTNCPVVSGQIPLHTDNSPFYGALQSQNPYGGSSSNTLTLNFAFTQYTGFDSSTHNIVGSGAFNFPDLLTTQQTPGLSVPYNICISSANLNNAPPIPGTYRMQDGSIAMSMYGVIQVPLYNPYSGYPGSYQPGGQPTPPQMGQDTIQVDLGMTCPAFLNNSRIYGCVDVKVGTSPYGPRLRYNSR